MKIGKLKIVLAEEYENYKSTAQAFKKQCAAMEGVLKSNRMLEEINKELLFDIEQLKISRNKIGQELALAKCRINVLKAENTLIREINNEIAAKQALEKKKKNEAVKRHYARKKAKIAEMPEHEKWVRENLGREVKGAGIICGFNSDMAIAACSYGWDFLDDDDVILERHAGRYTYIGALEQAKELLK